MLEKIKKIREATGAGVIDIKKALEEANGAEDKAIQILRQKGLEKAVKKSGREAKEGFIGSYIHTNGKVAAFVKLYCETDFVGRNEEFKDLAKDLAMHAAAMNPTALRPEDVSVDVIEESKGMWKKELADQNKPVDLIEKIIAGKEEKLRKEAAFLTQPFVKDPEKTVEEVVKEKIAKIGENIQVGDFVRFEL